jgi:hypothetical protein
MPLSLGRSRFERQVIEHQVPAGQVETCGGCRRPPCAQGGGTRSIDGGHPTRVRMVMTGVVIVPAGASVE